MVRVQGTPSTQCWRTGPPTGLTIRWPCAWEKAKWERAKWESAKWERAKCERAKCERAKCESVTSDRFDALMTACMGEGAHAIADAKGGVTARSM